MIMIAGLGTGGVVRDGDRLVPGDGASGVSQRDEAVSH